MTGPVRFFVQGVPGVTGALSDSELDDVEVSVLGTKLLSAPMFIGDGLLFLFFGHVDLPSSQSDINCSTCTKPPRPPCETARGRGERAWAERNDDMVRLSSYSTLGIEQYPSRVQRYWRAPNRILIELTNNNCGKAASERG